jgi:hypothetical protein
MPHRSQLRGAESSSVHFHLTRALGRGMRHRDECMRAAEDLPVKASWGMSSPDTMAGKGGEKIFKKCPKRGGNRGYPGPNTAYERVSLRLTLGVER